MDDSERTDTERRERPTPVEEHPERFEPAEPGTLASQRSLVDEQGEDIRQYTGEPVETDQGWVVPAQQSVGKDNVAGGGEFPDPNTPPVQPIDEAEDPASE